MDLDVTVIRGLEILSRAVLDARRHAGLTQRQLGAIAGVHQSTISRLERGRLAGMRLRVLGRILAALGRVSFVALDPTISPAYSAYAHTNQE
jgi:transcriptional regulator with XRE-family HTH domain